MWHGTNLTDPKKIYNGEGFDTKFAKDNNFWGKAIYFAANAKYSCENYGYKLPYGYELSDGCTLPNGTKVVIFVKV